MGWKQRDLLPGHNVLETVSTMSDIAIQGGYGTMDKWIDSQSVFLLPTDCFVKPYGNGLRYPCCIQADS